ncbi:MAG: MBL fold metallo-hydrolase [bacterium]
MRVFAVEGNRQRLDGGAMFGNAPRPLWSRWCPPDALNRIDLAARSLLVVEPAGRRILFEAGIGAFLAPELAERYGVYEPSHRLLESLEALGVAPEDIDVIVLSHLHFDHAGGLLAAWQANRAPALCFPRARYVTGVRALERAAAPHPRDRASFIAELPALLRGTGRLELVEGGASDTLGPSYRHFTSEGHTPGLLLTRIQGATDSLLVVGDLAPGIPWLHLPITMGYDRYPERLVDEKRERFEQALGDRSWVFFTHDPQQAFCRLGRDERGRFHAVDARVEPFEL